MEVSIEENVHRSKLDLANILTDIERNDTSYGIRETLVMKAMKTAQDAGFTVGVRCDPGEEHWPVHCIFLPNIGEVSWHCEERADSWSRFPSWDTPYSGYTTAEKYRRCRTFTKETS